MPAMRTLGLVRAAASTTLGGGENQAFAQIYAASGSPRLWRVLPDVDRVDAQRVVGGFSVQASGRRQCRCYKAESDQRTHDRSRHARQMPSGRKIGRRVAAGQHTCFPENSPTEKIGYFGF